MGENSTGPGTVAFAFSLPLGISNYMMEVRAKDQNSNTHVVFGTNRVSEFCKGILAYMKHFLSEHNFVCEPIMFAGDGPALVPFDEQHAFRYEVRDNRGNVLGFINTDRALDHPEVKWELSLLRNGRIEELDGAYETVQEAFKVFQGVIE